MKRSLLISVIGLFFTILVIVSWSVSGFTSTNKPRNTGQVGLQDIEPQWPDSMPASVPRDRYGVPVRNWIRVDANVSRNDRLADILVRYGLSPAGIHRLVLQSRGTFDMKSIRPGHDYRLYLDQDSVIHYLAYHIDPVDYVVFKTQDSLTVYTGTRSITSRPCIASGTIRSSLSGALSAEHLDPSLAGQLAEIFAWQVDFYHLQKGDHFRFIYDEQYVEGKPVGAGPILAVLFSHRGETFYAYRYDQNGKHGYFDESGNSLRKAFLKAPLKYTRISSRFSLHRYHPILHRNMPHLGVDFAAPTGTPIHSTGDGVIEVAGYSKYNGNWVKIRHNSIYETGYLHMSHIAKGIHPGVHVKQGQLIGYVGSTGLATGPHVCYRFWKNGVQVNALKVRIPPSHPIKSENLADYYRHIALWQAEINRPDGSAAPALAEDHHLYSHPVLHIGEIRTQGS